VSVAGAAAAGPVERSTAFPRNSAQQQRREVSIGSTQLVLIKPAAADRVTQRGTQIHRLLLP
jgi:hypothetical protein